MANSFDHCRRHHNLFVCPPLGPVFDASVDTCGSANFLGKHETTTLCEPYVLKHFPPILIKGDGQWTFSTSKPLTLTLNCSVNPVNKLRQVINGTDILTLSQGCSAHSQTLTLSAYDTIAEFPPLTIKTSPLSVDINPRPAEATRLQNVSDPTFLDGNRSPIPLTKLMNKLQPIHADQVMRAKPLPRWISVLVIVLAVLVLVGSLAIGVYVFYNTKKPL